MAKLVLTDRPTSGERYISEVIVGASLKLQGQYKSKGPETQSSNQNVQASGSWLPGFWGASASIENAIEKATGPNSSSWNKKVLSSRNPALTIQGQCAITSIMRCIMLRL